MAKKAKRNTKKKKAGTPFYKNKSFHTFLGFFNIFLGLFLLLAFISYFNNWKADQNLVSKPFFELLSDPNYSVQNLLGKLGAVTAHQFIHRWFGWPSILFAGLLFILGSRVLVGPNFKISIPRYIKHIIFYLIWLPLLTAYIFPNSSLSGSIAHETKVWLMSIAGPWGSSLILTFVGIAFFSIAYNISPEKIRSFLGKSKSKLDSLKDNVVETAQGLNQSAEENIAQAAPEQNNAEKPELAEETPIEPVVLDEEPNETKIDLDLDAKVDICLLYTSPSPRDRSLSRMPSSA